MDRLDADPAAVLLNDLVDHRQAQARTLGLRGEKGLEDLLADFLGDARTFVLDLKLCPALGVAEPHRYPAPIGRGLQGIGEEVPVELAEPVGICQDPDGTLSLEFKGDPLGFGILLGEANSLLEELGPVETFRLELPGGLDILQELGHELVQAGGLPEDNGLEPLGDGVSRLLAAEEFHGTGDGCQGVAHLMGHCGGESSQGGEALLGRDLRLEPVQLGAVLEEVDLARWAAVWAAEGADAELNRLLLSRWSLDIHSMEAMGLVEL